MATGEYRGGELGWGVGGLLSDIQRLSFDILTCCCSTTVSFNPPPSCLPIRPVSAAAFNPQSESTPTYLKIQDLGPEELRPARSNRPRVGRTCPPFQIMLPTSA